jgi:hypothetical protein
VNTPAAGVHDGPVPPVGPSELVAALGEVGACSPQDELVAVAATPIGIGAMADTYRLQLHWAAPGGAGRPDSLVAKLPATDEAAARTASSLGAYAREVRFYRDLGGHTDVSLPRYLGTVTAQGVPGGLLLEDLSHLVPGDQFTDVPPPTLRRLREQLARLQAPFWDDPAIASQAAGPDGWLHQRLGVPIPGIIARMERSWSVARDTLAGGFDAQERSQIDRFVARAGEWAESLRGPFSLTHHDYRVDNVLFDAAGDDRLVVLDWQTVGWGAPMFDVAYLLGTSSGPEARRAGERDEIARHVDDLAARGVEWSSEDAWTAYRQASFATLLMLVPPTGSVKRSDRSNAMFRRLLRQGARMALDLQADEFLLSPTG